MRLAAPYDAESDESAIVTPHQVAELGLTHWRGRSAVHLRDDIADTDPCTGSRRVRQDCNDLEVGTIGLGGVPRQPLVLPANFRDVPAERVGTIIGIGATAAKATKPGWPTPHTPPQDRAGAEPGARGPSGPESCPGGNTATAFASIAGMMLHCGEWSEGQWD
jgi:hypothetical protein